MATAAIKQLAEPAEPTGHSHAAGVRKALTRNIGPAMLARTGYLLSRICIPPFVISRIGLEAYGLWSATFILVSYLGISNMGLSAVYIKYVAEYTARGETDKANSLLSTGMMIASVISLVFMASLWLLWPEIQSWLKIPPPLQGQARAVLFLTAGMFSVDLSLSIFRDSLNGSQKIAEANVFWTISYLVEAALIVYLVQTGRGVLGLAEAFAARQVVWTVLAAAAAFRMQPWLRISPRLCSREALRAFLSFGVVVQLSALLSTALNAIERIIAAPLIGLAAVGLLDMSDKLPNMGVMIPSTFAMCFLPAASSLQSGLTTAARRREMVADLYLRGARYMNLTTGLILGLMATASGPVMAVWMGHVYPGTVFLLCIFAIQQQIHAMTGPGTSILKGIGRPNEELFYSIGNIAALLVTVPIARIVLGRWSAVGLGSAAAAATLISAVGFIIRANGLLGIPWRRYLGWVAAPGLLPYMVGFVIAWPARLIVPHVSRGWGVVVLGIVGLVYSVALGLVTERLVLELDEREWVYNKLGHLLSRYFGANRMSIKGAA